MAGVWLVTCQASARRITVKVDKKALDEQDKVLAAADSANLQADTLTLEDDAARQAVRLYGYDKPHNASKESLFASNLLATDTITALQFEVQYFTLDDIKLHTRLVRLPVLIPPGESMRLHYTSWDATHTFYYYRTPPRRKENLNPYKVGVTVKRADLAPGMQRRDSIHESNKNMSNSAF